MSYSTPELVAMLARMIGHADAKALYDELARTAVSYSALSYSIVTLTGHKE